MPAEINADIPSVGTYLGCVTRSRESRKLQIPNVSINQSGREGEDAAPNATQLKATHNPDMSSRRIPWARNIFRIVGSLQSVIISSAHAWRILAGSYVRTQSRLASIF